MVNHWLENVAYCRATIYRRKWHGFCFIYLFGFMKSQVNKGIEGL